MDILQKHISKFHNHFIFSDPGYPSQRESVKPMKVASNLFPEVSFLSMRKFVILTLQPDLSFQNRNLFYGLPVKAVAVIDPVVIKNGPVERGLS
jgi:hypothetical protein